MSKTLHGQYFFRNGGTLALKGRSGNFTISLVLFLYAFLCLIKVEPM